MTGTPTLMQVDGWWWPASDRRGRPVIARDCEEAVRALLPHVQGRDCIVQAGANVGLYPVALADLFQRVVTAEPDPANILCLSRNLEARDALRRIEAHAAALGDGPGWCEPVVVEPDNCGAHRVEFAPAMRSGPVRVLSIDSLQLPACDAIWLDIEGAEHFALVGAEETIARFAPTICVEDKGLHRAFGLPDGHLQAWLSERGYAPVASIGNDKVFRRTP